MYSTRSEHPVTEVTCDVVVVGAGPTGLMVACVLAKLGVNAVVLDEGSGPTQESRALALQSRTMEIYDQLGMVDEVSERAVVADALAMGFERRELGRIPLDGGRRSATPYPAIHILEQSENERLLHEHLQRSDGRVLWGHRVTALEDRPGGVLVTAQSADVTVRVRARWCVGADGASSVVRGLRGIPFEGTTNERSFYVADAVGVQGVGDAAVNERLAGRDFLLTFPMGSPHGGARSHHRLLGAARGLHDDQDDDNEDSDGGAPGSADAGVTEGGIRSMLEKIYGVTYEKVTWFTTYRVHHRVAGRFRDGAVFLAGDAAHVHSPLGAQGMNTGLQDAHGLATKLADVASGVASDASLDRYDTERRAVALNLVRKTDRIFRAVTADTRGARFVRRRLVPIVVPVLARIAPHLPDGGLGFTSQVHIHYSTSGALPAARGQRGKVVGRRLPWTPEGHAATRSMRWQVHSYGPLDDRLAEALRHRLDLDVHAFDTARGTGLRAGQLYLVRPDGFVAAAVPIEETKDTAGQLLAALPDRWGATARQTVGRR